MTTKSIEITKDWQQVSSGDCVVQSLFYVGQFCVAIGGVPSDDNAYLLTKLNEPLTLEFGKPVFVKLPHSHTGNVERLTVIV